MKTNFLPRYVRQIRKHLIFNKALRTMSKVTNIGKYFPFYPGKIKTKQVGMTTKENNWKST